MHVYNLLPTWRVIGLDATLFISAFGRTHKGHISPMYKITGSLHAAAHLATGDLNCAGAIDVAVEAELTAIVREPERVRVELARYATPTTSVYADTYFGTYEKSDLNRRSDTSHSLDQTLCRLIARMVLHPLSQPSNIAKRPVRRDVLIEQIEGMMPVLSCCFQFTEPEKCLTCVSMTEREVTLCAMPFASTSPVVIRAFVSERI